MTAFQSSTGGGKPSSRRARKLITQQKSSSQNGGSGAYDMHGYRPDPNNPGDAAPSPYSKGPPPFTTQRFAPAGHSPPPGEKKTPSWLKGSKNDHSFQQARPPPPPPVPSPAPYNPPSPSYPQTSSFPAPAPYTYEETFTRGEEEVPQEFSGQYNLDGYAPDFASQDAVASSPYSKGPPEFTTQRFAPPGHAPPPGQKKVPKWLSENSAETEKRKRRARRRQLHTGEQESEYSSPAPSVTMPNYAPGQNRQAPVPAPSYNHSPSVAMPNQAPVQNKPNPPSSKNHNMVTHSETHTPGQIEHGAADVSGGSTTNEDGDFSPERFAPSGHAPPKKGTKGPSWQDATPLRPLNGPPLHKPGIQTAKPKEHQNLIRDQSNHVPAWAKGNMKRGRPAPPREQSLLRDQSNYVPAWAKLNSPVRNGGGHASQHRATPNFASHHGPQMSGNSLLVQSGGFMGNAAKGDWSTRDLVSMNPTTLVRPRQENHVQETLPPEELSLSLSPPEPQQQQQPPPVRAPSSYKPEIADDVSSFMNNYWSGDGEPTQDEKTSRVRSFMNGYWSPSPSTDQLEDNSTEQVVSEQQPQSNNAIPTPVANIEPPKPVALNPQERPLDGESSVSVHGKHPPEFVDTSDSDSSIQMENKNDSSKSEAPRPKTDSDTHEEPLMGEPIESSDIGVGGIGNMGTTFVRGETIGSGFGGKGRGGFGGGASAWRSNSRASVNPTVFVRGETMGGF